MRRRVVVIAFLVCVGAVTRARAQGATAPEGWVVLPVDEYRTLRDRAYPVPPPAPALPVDAALTRIDYDLRTDGETAIGRATLTIDVLRDGWTRVAMPAGLIVRDASIDGRRVSMVDAGAPHLLLPRAGRFIVTLDVVIPIAASAGAEAIALPPSPAPITRARLVLARSGIDVAVGGGFVAARDESAGESRWTVFGRPGAPLSLTWKRRVDDHRAEQPLRLRARIVQMVGLAEESCQISATIQAEVLQGSTREITLQVPSGIVVNEVNGPTVADWDVAGGTLRVRLLEPTMAEASFVVQADARTARDGAIGIPIIRMPAAERESGGVAVDISGAGEIEAQQARGFDRADPSELGDAVAARESPSMIAFRQRPASGAEGRSLAVRVVRYTPQAVVVANVEEARYRALASEDGRLLVDARFAVRNNQRSFLKVALPAGATLWSVELAGRPVQPGLAADGSILLPLEKGRAGEQAPTFVVGLAYFQRSEPWTDKGHPRLELPTLDLPVSRTGVELHHSPRFQIEPQAGAFRVDRDQGPSAEALRVPLAALAVAVAPAVGGARRGSVGGASGGVAAGVSSGQPQDGLQKLVDRFRNEAGGRTAAGLLPVRVEFPGVGPSIFLASELTAESHTPSIELFVKRVSH